VEVLSTRQLDAVLANHQRCSLEAGSAVPSVVFGLFTGAIVPATGKSWCPVSGFSVQCMIQIHTNADLCLSLSALGTQPPGLHGCGPEDTASTSAVQKARGFAGVPSVAFRVQRQCSLRLPPPSTRAARGSPAVGEVGPISQWRNGKWAPRATIDRCPPRSIQKLTAVLSLSALGSQPPRFSARA
jgi:hypothetical protein